MDAGPDPDWPVGAPLRTKRLRLEPLRAAHALEAFEVFDDVRLHEWTGGAPDDWAAFQERYRRQSLGRSPDGGQGWLNWLLRRLADEQLLGLVQATVYRTSAGGLAGELAWVVGSDYQGNGYAREASGAMAGWLVKQGVTELAALIHPGNVASIRVARALGLTPTELERDGELLWIARSELGQAPAG